MEHLARTVVPSIYKAEKVKSGSGRYCNVWYIKCGNKITIVDYTGDIDDYGLGEHVTKMCLREKRSPVGWTLKYLINNTYYIYTRD